jgi:hypothetical protein
MLKRTFSCLILTVLSTFSLQYSAYSLPTKWEKVDSNLTDLLNSGWTLVNTAAHRVSYSNSIGPSSKDRETYIFSLIKGRTYIICSVVDPSPPVAETAICRKIN